MQPRACDAFALPANFTLKPRGSGRPLPESIQKKMESLFNTSFADVRVHVGHEASSIGALAFTHGSDLYFAPGQYNPESTPGQQLLGHELTHVVQQRAGRVRNPIGPGIAVVQDPGLEAEAERMGQRAAAFVPPIQAKSAALGPGGAPWRAAGLRSNAVTANGAILPASSSPQVPAQCKPASIRPAGTSSARPAVPAPLAPQRARTVPHGSPGSAVVQPWPDPLWMTFGALAGLALGSGFVAPLVGAGIAGVISHYYYSTATRVRRALSGLRQQDLSKESILAALEREYGSRSALHAATKDPEFSQTLLEEVRHRQHQTWITATEMRHVAPRTWASQNELNRWNVRHYSSKMIVVLGDELETHPGIFRIANVLPPPFTDILSTITIATFPTSSATGSSRWEAGGRVTMSFSSGAATSGHTTGIDWSNIGNVGDTFYGLFYGDEPATGVVPNFIRDGIFYATWPVTDSGTDWWASADWLGVAKKSHLPDTDVPSGESRTGSLTAIIADIFPAAATRLNESPESRTQRRAAFNAMRNFEVKKHSPMHVNRWIAVDDNVNKIGRWFIDPTNSKFYKGEMFLPK